MSGSIESPEDPRPAAGWPQGAGLAELASQSAQPDADAAALATLWRTRDRWINRSVERVSFRETARMHRALSLDVEIPWDHFDAAHGHKRQSIPVPLLVSDRTSDLVAIEVRDSSGRLLPVRSPAETLLAAAGALRLIVNSSDRVLQPLGEESEASADQDPAAAELSRADWPNEANELVQALSRRQLLLVDFPRSDARRDVLRIDWDETIAPAGRRLWISPKSGLAIKAAAVASPSRHISIDAPPGFEINELRFHPPDDAVDVPIADETQHLEAAAIDGGELLLALRPTRRAAVQLFGPAVAIVGLSIALLATSTLSSSQSAVSALLLLAPAALAIYAGRPASVGSWLGWDIESFLIATTSFVAAVALALEVGQVALDILLSLAAIAGAVASVAALRLASGGGSPKGSPINSGRIFVSHSAQPSTAPSPTDEEVRDAVDALIQSAVATEEPNSALEVHALQERAAELATERSYVEISRPVAPELTGALVEDVLRLTEIDPEDLAAYLEISAALPIDQSREDELSEDDLRKLAGVRAAALVLFGGLDPAGVRSWLTSGETPPLKMIADGDVEDLQLRLDAYTSSPAE